MAAHATAGGHAAHVIEVNDATFEAEVLRADVPVLVDFGAAWCGPCRALAPIVERIAAENEGRIKVVTVDTDESPRTAQRYGVRGVPMVIVFKNGEKTGSHLGMTTKERLMGLIGGAGVLESPPGKTKHLPELGEHPPQSTEHLPEHGENVPESRKGLLELRKLLPELEESVSEIAMVALE